MTGALFAFNESVNNRHFFVLHNDPVTDHFSCAYTDFRFINNTIIEAGVDAGELFWTSGASSAASFRMENNIVEKRTPAAVFAHTGITHAHNLYHLSGDASVGDPLGAGEQGGDPRFVDFAGGNFRLASGSPARDVGVTAPLAFDLDGRTVPRGMGPDLGAYEH
jgi:hypothetical protein